MALMFRKKRPRVLAAFVLFAVFAALFFQTPQGQKIFYPYPYRQSVEKYSAQYDVDPLLVLSVMRAESKFLPQSTSPKGALGLMQLMPETALWIAESIGDKEFSLSLLKEPDKNIQYGTWYLANLQKEFKNTTLVLAAYNGGRGHVKEWIRTNQLNLSNLREQDIPFPETREYVTRVINNYVKYTELYAQPQLSTVTKRK